MAALSRIPYGRQEFELPAAGTLIAPREAGAAADEGEAVRAALRAPTGTPPLREIVKPGETVAVLVNDITRISRTDLMLPAVVEELNAAGVPDRDIFVVFAKGNHRAQSEAERRRILGEEMFHRLRSYEHDACDGLVTVGVTSRGNTIEINRRVREAGRIVLTGEIMHHMFAGFSGGRKSLVPGVAGARTITYNHRMLFHPRCAAGVLDGNPIHEDMLEACRMIGPDFILNVVLTAAGKVAHAVAGDFEQAHLAGCQVADRLLRTPVEGRYDVVIASAGGHPLDIDLRQAHKGMENACMALRRGGVLFYYAECGSGLGSPAVEQYLARYNGAAEMQEALEREFVVGGHKAFWLARLGESYQVYLVSSLDPQWAARCRFRHVAPADHTAALREALRLAGPAAHIALMPRAGFTLPIPSKEVAFSQ